MSLTAWTFENSYVHYVLGQVKRTGCMGIIALHDYWTDSTVIATGAAAWVMDSYSHVWYLILEGLGTEARGN